MYFWNDECLPPTSDIPITTPDFWVDEERCTEELLKHVFRSATDGEIPMFKERVQCLREAGEVLCEVLFLITFAIRVILTGYRNSAAASSTASTAPTSPPQDWSIS